MLLMTYQLKYVSQIKKYSDLNIFNITTKIDQSETITKHISRNGNCKFNKRCSLNQKLNKGKCRCECKNPINHHACKNSIRYLGSDLVASCNEIIEKTKNTSTNVKHKKAACKIDNFHILPAFLLITMFLLIILCI